MQDTRYIFGMVFIMLATFHILMHLTIMVYETAYSVHIRIQGCCIRRRWGSTVPEKATEKHVEHDHGLTSHKKIGKPMADAFKQMILKKQLDMKTKGMDESTKSLAGLLQRSSYF